VKQTIMLLEVTLESSLLEPPSTKQWV